MSQTSKTFGPLRASHLVAVLMAAGAALWVASGVVTGKAPATKDGATAGPKPAEVLTLVRTRPSVAEPHHGEVVLFGRTEAVVDAELAAETAGRVVSRHLAKGEWAKKGDPLFQLAMDDRQARLNEAEAKVDHQQIAYDAAKQLSQKQFQSKVKLAEAAAMLAQAEAALAAIRLDIDRTAVRAPIDGFVETLPADVGDYVKVGEVVATIVNLNPIRVVAQVSERNVTRLQPGTAAWTLLPDGRSLQGEVRYVSKVGTAETRTFRVEIWIDNAGHSVPEGLTTEVKIPTGTEAAHRVSPAVLTLDDAGVIGIKAIDDENRVVFHPARILADTSEGIWLGGLPDALTLITVGQEFVQAGQKVRALDESQIGKTEAGDKAAGS